MEPDEKAAPEPSDDVPYSLNIYSPHELVQQSWELRQKQVKGQMSTSKLGRKRELDEVVTAT